MGARQDLQAILDAVGIGSLIGPAWDLNLAGITQPDQVLQYLEPTQEFQARFPGLRDPVTKQLIMTPSEYLSYEKSVRSMFAEAGITQPDQAQIGSYVQQRKSPNELKTEMDAFRELKQNPYVAHEFYAITGHDPGPEGLFAYLTGQNPDLEQIYNNAVAGGVDPNEYATRLAQRTGRNVEDITAALQADPTTAFNSGQPLLNNMDKVQALARAVSADQAQFKAGGSALPQSQKIFTSF